MDGNCDVQGCRVVADLGVFLVAVLGLHGVVTDYFVQAKQRERISVIAKCTARPPFRMQNRIHPPGEWLRAILDQITASRLLLHIGENPTH